MSIVFTLIVVVALITLMTKFGLVFDEYHETRVIVTDGDLNELWLQVEITDFNTGVYGETIQFSAPYDVVEKHIPWNKYGERSQITFVRIRYQLVNGEVKNVEVVS